MMVLSYNYFSMQSINSTIGKLLFFARHLHQTKQINNHQLACLKDMILAETEEVRTVFEEYSNLGTELTLTSSLIRLIHHEKESDSDVGSQSSGSKQQKSRKGMKVIIPKRNIQKMPAGMGRV